MAVVAVIPHNLPVLDLHDGLTSLAEEPSVVRHNHNRAIKLPEGILQGLLHRHVQMIRGLIKDEQLRWCQHHPYNCQPCLLAPGKVHAIHFQPVALEPELLQYLHQLGVVHEDLVCILHHLVGRHVGRQQVRLVLREETRLLGVGRHDVAALLGGLLGSQEKPEERRLAHTVPANDADLLGGAHSEAGLLQEHTVGPVPVAVRDVCQLRDGVNPHGAAPRLWRFREVKLDLADVLGRRVKPLVRGPPLLQLSDLLVARHGHHLLAAVDLDEVLHLLQLLLLDCVLLAPRLQLFITLLDVRAVAACVGVRHALHCLHSHVADTVHELSVMRHQHDGQSLLLQEALEPLNALQVQVVGGLVQQQHVRGCHEDLGKTNADLPATREKANLLLQVLLEEAHLAEDAVHAAVEVVGAQLLRLDLEVCEELDELHPLFRIRPHLLNLLLDIRQLLQNLRLLRHGREELLLQRALGVELVHEALREDRNASVGLALHRVAPIGRQLPCENLELRGLATAVRAHEGHAVTSTHHPRGVLKNFPATKPY
mmetsp:Transcript_20282/g.55299  ORF Transcript_20282/g.55299 Transcript_20282/m.55299 type:complete len:540 (-) Transcript_20282:104-1723(-)